MLISKKYALLPIRGVFFFLRYRRKRPLTRGKKSRKHIHIPPGTQAKGSANSSNKKKINRELAMKYTTLLILNQKDISLMVKLDVSAILIAVQVCNILSTIIGNFVYQ